MSSRKRAKTSAAPSVRPATTRTRACARAPAWPPPMARWRSISLCTARVWRGCCIFSWARSFDSRSNVGCLWSSLSPSTRSASSAPSSPSIYFTRWPRARRPTTIALLLVVLIMHVIMLAFLVGGSGHRRRRAEQLGGSGGSGGSHAASRGGESGAGGDGERRRDAARRGSRAGCRWARGGWAGCRGGQRMCGGRAGAARSCARVFARVVGARIAGVVCQSVCMCVAGHAAGSRQTGADAAPCGRAGRSPAGFDACAYQKYNLISSS